MDIQAERIRVSCELLGLDRVPEIYPVVAEAAIKAEQGFADSSKHCSKRKSAVGSSAAEPY